MSSQIHRGISLFILPLPSERDGERLFFLIPSSQTQRGIPLITPLSLRRGVGGEAVSDVFQASVRYMFRLYEILLQTVRCYCSQINLLSLKIAFVTIKESIGYKEACKRCPFALQNMPFYTSKDALLHCKRA